MHRSYKRKWFGWRLRQVGIFANNLADGRRQLVELIRTAPQVPAIVPAENCENVLRKLECLRDELTAFLYEEDRGLKTLGKTG